MSDPNVHDDPEPSMTEIEAALGSLTPAANRLNRDRTLYLTGQAQARADLARRSTGPSRWMWPALAASLGLIAAGEGAILATRPGPSVVERVVYVPQPLIAAAAETTPPSPEQARNEGSQAPPAPVASPDRPRIIILSRSDRPGRLSNPNPWPTLARPIELRREILARGVEALPEPLPLAIQAGSDLGETSGVLLRTEIESLRNPRNSS